MRLSLYFWLLGASACAPSLALDSDDSNVVSDNFEVNATDYESWVYLDLQSGEFVSPETPDDSTEWDLGFQRFKVKLNGGVSGSADMVAAEILAAVYEELTQAPGDGYVTDEADTDADEIPEYALKDWYDYDETTHTLTPADKVYAIRSVEGDYFKLRFLSYYNDAGTPAKVSFQWDSLEAP